MIDPAAAAAHAPGPPSVGRRIEAAALAAILFAALALRLWGLTQNGWGAEYYSAAVRSMAYDLHNFLHAAFDGAGFLSVDKPPLALWIQVASVRLFGFHPISLLAPQAIAGVASVWLLYRLVRRGFGAIPALLAALFLALMPVSVAANRTNNMDSVLVLLLLLAAWALLVAAEHASRRHLLLSMAAMGAAFNVKMLAAFIVLPALIVVYALGAPAPWRRRAVDLLVASAVLITVALPWTLWREFTPADQRPFVGSSRENSALELVVGHNARARFVANRSAPAASTAATDDAGGDTRSNVRRLVTRLFVRTPPGPLRLAGGQMAAQVSWLLPLAILGAACVAQTGAGAAAPVRDTRRRRLGIALWVGWAVACWAVYSHLGGIVHFYYLASLAPAIAALAGIGAAALWRGPKRGAARAASWSLALLATAAWQLWIQASAMDWSPQDLLAAENAWLVALHATPLGAALLAGIAIVTAARLPTGVIAARLHASAVAVGIGGLLVLPLGWASSSVLLPGQGMLPSADLARLMIAARDPAAIPAARFGRSADTAMLVAFLTENRNGERYLLATSTTQLAAPIIIATGEPVIARGGFHGTDPTLTPERIARLVERGELRYAMLGDVAQLSRRMGADAAGRPVDEWIRSNGRAVDPSLWRAGRASLRMELFDLRPTRQGDDTPR